MAYYCVKCKKNHIRGSIFESHAIYDEANNLIITEDMKLKPFEETCYSCEHHDKMLDQGGHYCKLLVNNWDQYMYELSSWGWSFHIPKACFRVPRTSEIYRKCKYYNKKVSAKNER